MKWQLGLRWNCSNDEIRLIPFVKLVPNPEVEEKLGDVWICIANVIVNIDGTRRFSVSMTHGDRNPCVILNKSKSYHCFLTSDNNPFTIKGVQDSVAVSLDVVLIKHTLATIERVAIPPCPILQDYGSLLALGEEECEDKFCDMKITATIQAGEDCQIQSEFSAHKVILAARSPVLAKMFSHDMQENATNTLNLPDITPDVLKELLTYIYTGESPNLKTHAESLLYQAEKYELSHLKALCEERLSFDLEIDTAAKTLILADACDAQQLKRNTVLFINKHGGEVQNTEEWKDVKENAALLHDLVTTMYEPAAKRRKV